jgi:hypothetical protein
MLNLYIPILLQNSHWCRNYDSSSYNKSSDENYRESSSLLPKVQNSHRTIKQLDLKSIRLLYRDHCNHHLSGTY